jgi:hypothetical protein
VLRHAVRLSDSPIYLFDQFVDNSHYAARYVETRLVLVLPLTERLPVVWQRLQLGERCLLPKTRTQNHRHDTRRARIVATKGGLTFHLVAISRFDEMGAYKEQYDSCTIQSPIYFLAPFRASWNLPVVPLQDAPVSHKNDKLTPNSVHQFFILVRIGEEDLDHVCHPRFLP